MYSPMDEIKIEKIDNGFLLKYCEEEYDGDDTPEGMIIPIQMKHRCIFFSDATELADYIEDILSDEEEME